MTITSVSYTTNCSDHKASNVSFKAKPIPVELAKNIKTTLLDKSVRSVDLYCHNSPDEDTVNAMKVLYNWLKRNGKKVSACLNTEDTVGLYFNRLLYRQKRGNKVPDKAVCVDFNGFERVPKHFGMNFMLNDTKNIMGFDHHNKSDTLIKSNDLYIDDKSYSCCGVIYRFFEAIKENLPKKDVKSLYCGMLSDYRGSKLVKIKKTEQGYQLLKTNLLKEDPDSQYVLQQLESRLSEKDKNKIYQHLDIMSRLSGKEKRFMKDVVSEISVSGTGKLAYIFIDPNDSTWASVGMDNIKTSAILKDIRTRLLNGIQNDDLFTEHQKEKFKNLQAAAVFYRTSPSTESPYQMSIHSKNGYCEKLINYIKQNITPDLMAGGHPDRAGGHINSLKTDDVLHFVNSFLKADADIAALEKTQNLAS